MSILDSKGLDRLYCPPGSRACSITRNGHTVLASPPILSGSDPVYACDYASRIIATVRHTVGDRDEDMSDEERARAQALIDGVPSGPTPL